MDTLKKMLFILPIFDPILFMYVCVVSFLISRFGNFPALVDTSMAGEI